jgi:hypothetical protein
MDRLRFSTHKLIEHWIQPLTAQELQVSVSAFLDLRPDGFALHQKSQRFAILEFTRAMDASEEWEEKKFAEKRSRYAPFWISSILKALDITSRVNLEKIRKMVTKRTFDAHDLMLRSYYAVLLIMLRCRGSFTASSWSTTSRSWYLLGPSAWTSLLDSLGSPFSRENFHYFNLP